MYKYLSDLKHLVFKKGDEKGKGLRDLSYTLILWDISRLVDDLDWLAEEPRSISDMKSNMADYLQGDLNGFLCFIIYGMYLKDVTMDTHQLCSELFFESPFNKDDFADLDNEPFIWANKIMYPLSPSINKNERLDIIAAKRKINQLLDQYKMGKSFENAKKQAFKVFQELAFPENIMYYVGNVPLNIRDMLDLIEGNIYSNNDKFLLANELISFMHPSKNLGADYIEIAHKIIEGASNSNLVNTEPGDVIYHPTFNKQLRPINSKLQKATETSE